MNFSLHKNKIQILLLEGIHPRAIDYFIDSQYPEIKLLKTALSEEELIEQLENVYFLGIRSRTQVTERVLEKAQHLAAIGCFCIGTNQVNLQAAASRGIPVFNAPHSNTRSVAELVIGHTIMLMRNIFEKSLAAHEGRWLKSAEGSHEVRGKTLGIIGYGHIGTQVSVLAESLGMKVIFYDTQTKLPLGNAKAKKSLYSLLKESDVVTLHVPEDPSTFNLIGLSQLEQMKEGAYLINASRGNVVDIDTLREFLDSGRLRGAAIDVFPKEPKHQNEEFLSPLQGVANVILTPHVGGSTKEAQENIALEVSQKIISYSDKGSTDGAVNFPQVNLPLHEDAHRILHTHQNIPGMLQHINTLLAKEKINILGQHLQTLNDIGYVVLDIEKESSKRTLEKIKTIEGTIRARLLY